MKKSVIGTLVLVVLAVIVYCMFLMKRDGFVTPRPGFITPRPEDIQSIINDLVKVGMTRQDASTLMDSVKKIGMLQKKYDPKPFTLPPGSPKGSALGNRFTLSQWVNLIAPIM